MTTHKPDHLIPPDTGIGPPAPIYFANDAPPYRRKGGKTPSPFCEKCWLSRVQRQGEVCVHCTGGTVPAFKPDAVPSTKGGEHGQDR